MALLISGLRRARVVLGKRLKADFALRSRDLNNHLGTLQNGEFRRVADVDGQVFLGSRQSKDALDEVGDVAEAARLLAIAVDREAVLRAAPAS